jgi:DNA-binding transcriptional regulator YhcF (GntR family)
MEEKIKSLYEDLKYINKSKNLMTKNVKNADQHIGSLNDALEDLRTQKYLLTKNKNDILVKGQSYEEKLKKLYPDFEKFIVELNKTNFDDDEELDIEQLRNSRSYISTQAINEVREQIRKGEVDLGSNPIPGFQQQERKPVRVIDREEDKRRVEKLVKLQKQQENTVIEERESEYYGSCISAGGGLNKISHTFENANEGKSRGRPKFSEVNTTAKFNDVDTESGKPNKKDKKDKCVIF